MCGVVLATAIMGLSTFADPGSNLDQPTHAEVESLKPVLKNRTGKIETLGMDARGRLLVSLSWSEDPNAAPAPRPPRRPGRGDRPGRPGAQRPPRGGALPARSAGRKGEIQVLSQQGKLQETWPMGNDVIHALHACADGTIFAGTDTELLTLNAHGKVTGRLRFKAILDGRYETANVAGLTADERHVFVAFGFGFSLRATEDVVRLDRNLENPFLVAERQYGCCGHIDLDLHGETLLIAENSRHRVNLISRDGKALSRWGRRDRTGLEGFAACCNPVNFDFGPDGLLYTAESGVGRVKKYTADGKFLGLVGYIDTTKFDRGSRLAAMSCYIPIEVGTNADRIFVMDVRANIIRVLQRHNASPNQAPSPQ